MRTCFTYIFILFSLATYCQQNIDLIVLKDDASSGKKKIKHLWVGIDNLVSSNYHGGFEILKIESDNGVISSYKGNTTIFSINPKYAGSVKITSTQKIWNGKKYDSIQTINTFKAILPPKILIQLDKERTHKHATLSFLLIDGFSFKPIGRRYKIGRFFEPVILDASGKVIGNLG